MCVIVWSIFMYVCEQYNTMLFFTQPYAWESREFLRKMIIGKEVNFAVENTAPSGREYGQLWVNKGQQTTPNNLYVCVCVRACVRVCMCDVLS